MTLFKGVKSGFLRDIKALSIMSFKSGASWVFPIGVDRMEGGDLMLSDRKSRASSRRVPRFPISDFRSVECSPTVAFILIHSHMMNHCIMMSVPSAIPVKIVSIFTAMVTPYIYTLSIPNLNPSWTQLQTTESHSILSFILAFGGGPAPPPCTSEWPYRL